MLKKLPIYNFADTDNLQLQILKETPELLSLSSEEIVKELKESNFPYRIIDRFLCDIKDECSCKFNLVEYNECPYSAEINDSLEECRCCSWCTRECYEDI